MTKDELKNRISLALKDPVLQQGFEIICKENTELSERLLDVSEQLRLLKEMPFFSSKTVYRSKNTRAARQQKK